MSKYSQIFLKEIGFCSHETESLTKLTSDYLFVVKQKKTFFGMEKSNIDVLWLE